MLTSFIKLNINSIKTIAGWIIINTALGTIIASFLSIGMKESFLDTFLISQITTHIVSSLSIVTARIVSRVLGEKSLMITLPVTIICTLIAATAGLGASSLIVWSFRDTISLTYFDKINNFFVTFIVPVLIVTSAITIIAILFKRLQDTKVRLERDILEIKGKIVMYDSASKDRPGLSFKDGDILRLVEYREIIYLSSYGKHTVIHTDKCDYETVQLLKQIEGKLPSEIFIRIHKQFIVNLTYIERLRYYMGGRYIVYLSNEEENNLPVGRTYTSVLKERLRAKP